MMGRSTGSRAEDAPEITEPLKKMLREFAQPAKRDLLLFLNDQVLREQELFWSRFSSFATIQAGLMAILALGPKDRPLPLLLTGTAFGVLWFLIQMNSFWYSRRLKDHYRDLREHMEIHYQGGPFSAYSSTAIGVVATLLVCVVWMYHLYPRLNELSGY